MSHRFIIQTKPENAPIWGDAEILENRDRAFERFYWYEEEGAIPGYDWLNFDHRLVVRLDPCSMAPINHRCQSGLTFPEGKPVEWGCANQAVFDAPSPYGAWGYWCAEHMYCDNPQLVNVITDHSQDVVLAVSL